MEWALHGVGGVRAAVTAAGPTPTRDGMWSQNPAGSPREEWVLLRELNPSCLLGNGRQGVLSAQGAFVQAGCPRGPPGLTADTPVLQPLSFTAS